MRLARPIAIACVLALAAPGAALAGFSSTVIDVSGDTTTAPFPDTATNAAGVSMVAWRESAGGGANVLRARRVTPAGGVGAPLTISDGSQQPAQWAVGIAPDGRVLVIWAESLGAGQASLRARWIAADDTLGPQFTARNGGVNADVQSPAVAITADGGAVATWRNANSTPAYRIEARAISAAGTIGALALPTEGPSVGGSAAVVPSGDGALVAWQASPAIYAMPIDASGAAGAVQSPVTANVLPGGFRLAGDGASQRVVWDDSGTGLTTVALSASGSASGAPQPFEAAGNGSSGSPLASIAPGGRALVVYGRPGGVVAARVIAADGGVEPGTVTAPAGAAQFRFGAGLFADGSGVMLWMRATPSGARLLESRTIGADGVAADAVTLAQPNADAGDFSNSPAGVGLAAWQQLPADLTPPYRVRARQFLPGPVCAPAHGTVVQGAPTTLALSCTGLQTGAPEVVTGPAHGRLDAVDAASGTVRYTPTPGFAGDDAFTFRASNPGGPGAAATAQIAVGRDTVRPAFTRARLTASRIRLRTAFRRPPARRPALVLTLSEPATIAVTVQRRVRPRIFRKVRVLRVGSAVTGARVLLPRSAVRPGAGRLVVVATDLAGNRSAPRRIGFRVLTG